MTGRQLTTDELRVKGFDALVVALGPADAIRFLHLFDIGDGDYTRDRFEWLGHKSAAGIYEELMRSREDEST